MAKSIHTLDVVNGSNQNRDDRLIVGVQSGIALPNGAGPTAVTVNWDMELPANYVPVVNPGQTGLTWYVDTKTSNSFVVHFVGASSGSKTFDVVVFG